MKALFIAKIVLTLLWVGASPAYAGGLKFEPINQVEMNSIHVTNVVWSARAWKGGSAPSHQIELGERLNADSTGLVTWNIGSDNPVSLVKESETITFNANGTGISIPLPAAEFNEIWISLENDVVLQIPPYDLTLNNETVNGVQGPGLAITASEEFQGYKVHLEGQNFSSFDFSGNLIPDHFFAPNKDWQFTVCAVMSRDLEPSEPEPNKLDFLYNAPARECVVTTSHTNPLVLEFADFMETPTVWQTAEAPFLKSYVVDGSNHVFTLDLTYAPASCYFRTMEE